MSELEKAQERFDKSDNLFRGGLTIFGILMTIVVCLVLFQSYTTQAQIAKNQKINTQASIDRFKAYQEDNQRLHLQTQQYVKCIANTLLLIPIDERTTTAFDQCSVNADTLKADTKAKE